MWAGIKEVAETVFNSVSHTHVELNPLCKDGELVKDNKICLGGGDNGPLAVTLCGCGATDNSTRLNGNILTADILDRNQAANQAQKCKDDPPLLDYRCRIYREGKPGLARWLMCWHKFSVNVPVFDIISACGLLDNACPISENGKKVITDQCSRPGHNGRTMSIDDTLECVVRMVHNELWTMNPDGTKKYPDSSCNHAAHCFKLVYEAIPGNSQYYNMKRMDLVGNGHAWNTIRTRTRTSQGVTQGAYQADAINDILVWCPI
ncbi:hypothetical protein A3D12_02560 [Candidatus Peribacteria bacterium RIFCSPHIGHO2_02_FULL_55_24]|nr:MAG: hypothetical protein A3D12_02560 [Candidatus Peribacteria bacterium RIFCSPHIGHO2_02_FULL_55_24]